MDTEYKDIDLRIELITYINGEPKRASLPISKITPEQVEAIKVFQKKEPSEGEVYIWITGSLTDAHQRKMAIERGQDPNNL